MNQQTTRNDIFNAMNTGRPFASYKKTILGQVRVTVWDNFLSQPTEKIIRGNPRANDDSCIIDVWSESEKVFFERLNENHFRTGTVIPFIRPQVKEAKEKPIEQYTDEELEKVVNSKYFALVAELNKVNTTAVLFRMRALAEENEKSEKIMQAIEARISDVQKKEFAPVKVEE